LWGVWAISLAVSGMKPIKTFTRSS